jgi:Tol biopolymer transport system component
MLSFLRRQFRELRHRRVFQVAGVYAVVAWIVVEVADTTFPHLGLPPWTITAVIVASVLGFPLALVLAWALELTPEGVRPQRGTDEAEPALTSAAAVGRGLRVGVILVIALAGVAAASLTYLRGNARLSSEPTTAAFATFTLSQITSSEEVAEFPAFSRDGRHMVFSREVTGLPRQLFIREMETGEEVQLTRAPADHIQPVFSPDGSTLLYVRSSTPAKLQPRDVFEWYEQGGGIWRMDLSTRRTELLLDDAYGPDFSPDGSRIAFDASWSGVRRIWTADELGRNPQMVTRDASDVVAHMAARWSPDGTRIAFQNLEKMKVDIGLVDLRNGEMSLLTDDEPRDLDPVWLTNEAVVFASYRGGGLNLWRIDVTAEGAPSGLPLQITTGAGQDLHPATTPDGRIAFVTMNQNSDIWRLPVDPPTGRPTGPPERLVTSTREDSRGVISPDGRLLAFNSDRAGNMNLWLLDLEQHRPRQLTHGPGGDYQARWSPDGTRLVYFSSRAGNADIWEVNVLTGAQRQLTTDPGVDVNPVYSRDGSMIAFQSDRGGRKDVWVMDSNGMGQRQLTRTGAGDHYMEWSADDQWIIYPAGPAGVQMVSVSTGETRPFPIPMGCCHLSFSPDFTRMADAVMGHSQIWVIPLDGSDPEPVLEFEDPDVRVDYTTWSPDGRWIVFDRFKPTGGDIWLLTPTAGRP